ncbi:MAG: serine/threonine protein kinase [Gammaproteobacteria bacterium]
MNQVETQALLTGKKIGVYEIKSLKHFGQLAISYRVKNEHMNAMEVLVEYFPGDIVRRAQDGDTVECLSENQQTTFDRGLQRFLEKAECWSEIEHPNIARVYNTLQFNGTGYLVMDNEQGTPLVKLLEASTTFGQTELEFLLTALLDAIRSAHEKGVIHGDIHPSTILIKSNGDPVLIDLVTNRLDAALDYDNRENYLRLNYAAPEIFESGYLPKPSADIYALGATIFRCMTHADPIPPAERLSVTGKGEADPVKAALESANGDYSETFLSTILRMLEPTEDKRLQTADAVLLNLGVSDRETAAAGVTEATQAAKQADASTGRSFMHVWFGAAVVLLLIVVGLWSSGTDDGQPAGYEDVTEAAPGEKPADSPVAEAPKSEAEDVASKTEALSVTQSQVENRTETATTSVTEANVPDNALSSVSERPDETLVKLQPDAKTFGEETSISESKKPLVAEYGEKQAAIEAHLLAANDALNALHLSTPADNNAYSHYRAVLELAPESVAAREGLQHIVDRYALLIERAVKMKHYHTARIYLDRAKAIKADDAALEKLGQELDVVQP